MEKRLDRKFFLKDVLETAPGLLGKTLVRVYPDGRKEKYIITETEAYRGEEDKACHASKGRTGRTEIMYQTGGHIYVYLIYGMYWMLNFVTGPDNFPQAVLIRCIKGFDGPGKLTKQLAIDKSFNGENLNTSDRIYICDGPNNISFKTETRVGIGYAGEEWINKPWRFILI
jgi:DNA-3-methyladenine glycosylase